ncbi:MAG: thioredoxin domain-containing protein [Saprospiraceae bacterium]
MPIEYTNQLIHETSPYLLQHAHNPVDWYAWNDEALKKAKDENKLLLISIGYSSCHWCHVMEHESFEDTAVANLMNAHFICIKVDREERPDIDDVYMAACQLSSGGNCGWPLNSFALPDGRPVWAGTYFPKGKWMDILEYFRKTYAEEPEKLEQYASQIVKGVKDHGLDDIVPAEDTIINQKDINDLIKLFISRMDPHMGGRRGAPKFPMPNNWQYLMHAAQRYNNKDAAAMVTTTMDKMMMGGIYDQLEGGFARYSTDSMWLVPHFEKMLYDNGQLASLYAKGYAWTSKPEYLEVLKQTLDFVDKNWSDPAGGFYSSYDADSEQEEGKYYAWSSDELKQIIPDAKERNVYFAYNDIRPDGNWEQGKNILHRHRPAAEISHQYNLTSDDFNTLISKINHALLEERKKRVAPSLDDKVLASWNGLMLEGFVDAYRASGEIKYLYRALKNANFLKKEMIKKDFRIERNYKNGKSTINGFLDDYANVIQGFIALYQSTFDVTWLDEAKEMTEHVLIHFKSDSTSLFYITSDLDPALIARRFEISDNVIPSSNSTMAKNLFVLGELLDKKEYTEHAQKMFNQVWPLIKRDGQPSFYSNWCDLMLMLSRTPKVVAIVGKDYESVLKELQKPFLPDVLYIGGSDEGNLELLKGKLADDQTLIYVCQNKICKLPTNDVNKAIELLRPQ